METEFKDIIAVPGVGGLFKVVGNNKNGFIVESMADGKRTMVSSSQRIMTLSDIAVYTTEDDLPLRDVFKKMQEADGKNSGIDPKDDEKKLRAFFRKIIPTIDDERVYASDLKKMLTWFQLLDGKVDFTKVSESDDSESDKLTLAGEQDKPVKKHHESHGPKAEKHAKASTARTRKKV